MYCADESNEPEKPTWLKEIVALKESTARYACFKGIFALVLAICY